VDQDVKRVRSINCEVDMSASKILCGEHGTFATLKQKIAVCNINNSPVRIEWSYNGKSGKGRLADINVNSDHLEFFIANDGPECGSFTLRSPRNMTAVSPQEGDNLCIFSDYMGNITILHNK
jgi:hypothetical protein